MIKKTSNLVLIFCVICAVVLIVDRLCFAKSVQIIPGIVGFGTTTPAGRGGKIVKVTNLKDSGSGTLREAVGLTGSRIVVFEISGRIQLITDLIINNPYITIAGQTAPSPGIQITDRALIIQTHDVLLQHVRVRPGDLNKKRNEVLDTCDSISIRGKDAYNIVVDHVTATWSIDGVLDITNMARDVTICNSILAEGLNKSLHSKGAHAFISLVAFDVSRISMFNNLLMNGITRFPYFKCGSLLFANNVIYNNGNNKPFSLIGGSDCIEKPSLASFVNNIYIKGSFGSPAFAIGVNQVHPKSAIYSSGNVFAEGRVEEIHPYSVEAPPLDTWPYAFVPQATELVMGCLLGNVGARPRERDAVENRLINQLITNTGRLIDSQEQVGGFPEYVSNYHSFNVGSNPHGDDDNDGYSNIEEDLLSYATNIERICKIQ